MPTNEPTKIVYNGHIPLGVRCVMVPVPPCDGCKHEFRCGVKGDIACTDFYEYVNTGLVQQYDRNPNRHMFRLAYRGAIDGYNEALEVTGMKKGTARSMIHKKRGSKA